MKLTDFLAYSRQTIGIQVTPIDTIRLMLDWRGAVHVHVTRSLSSTPQAKRDLLRDLGNWDKLFVPMLIFVNSISCHLLCQVLNSGF